MHTSHGTPMRKHIAHKRHRPDLPTQQVASPPTRRISMVASRPPSDLLAPSPTREPQSPHLPDDASMTPAHQPSDMEDTFVLDLQPVDTNRPSTPPMSIPPPTTPPQPQMSPATPQPQNPDQAFWDSWATQQSYNLDRLRRQTQLLSSLPHYLPRISRTMSRQNLEMSRISTCMEQMRADNSHMMNTLASIMDDQMRQHQNYLNLLETNKWLTESLGRIIENNTASNNQLNATLTNLSHNITLFNTQQASTSSETTTPINTPVTSPVRRSGRRRTNVPGPHSAAFKGSKQK
ncbi:cyclic AMP-dependent transcription factor ATF-7-like [Pseudophryne corroboree]|uniref:cyclic AMP-dependent transcription factor ATF-7-like n=1 Tax=Pseudophryne corroboree TaxID=495146 RepID=UPI003081EAB6